MPPDCGSPMIDQDLTSALKQHRATVVHFSHFAKMRSDGVFPDDLQNAINHKDEWALSCSVLWPGHTMQPCGSVGVIFRPTVNSVLSVYNNDAGSFSGPDGTDISEGWPLNTDSFEKTFKVAGAYNEWRVKGAEVAGIFVHNIYCINAKKMVSIPGLPNGETTNEIGCVPICLTEIFEAFGGFQISTMTSSGLVCINRP